MNGRWTRTDTSRDHDAWEYDAGDVQVELERDRPARYHGNGVSGYVTDTEAPARWSFTLWSDDSPSQLHRLPDGLSANAAKRLVVAAVAELGDGGAA